ncbi:MAG: hypothetical protein V4592_07335 [Bacteroidota bacterium]
MLLTNLIGQTVTDIFIFVEPYNEWLEHSECYIELNAQQIIKLPVGGNYQVEEPVLNSKAQSIFKDLSDNTIHYVNKEGKSIAELSTSFHTHNKLFFNRVKKWFGGEATLKEYKPYYTEEVENKLKYIVNRKIVDVLWYYDGPEFVYLELDNGYIITQNIMSPMGTGQAGLNYYVNIDALTEREEDDLIRLSDKQN